MAKKEFSLALVIRAVDRATEPLRRVNERIKQFTAPVRKLNNSLRGFAKEAGFPRLAKGFQGVGSSVRNVGKEALALGAKFGAMAAAASYAFVNVVSSAMKAGDDLATISQRVGLTADAYAQLEYAAAQADVEQKEFATAMDQLTKRVGEAKAGTGTLLDFLKKVSPTFAEQIRGAKDTEEAFVLLTAAFDKIRDPTRRAALANAAFGRSGMQMGVFLGQGSAAIAEQRERFFELMGSQEQFASGAGLLDSTLREMQTAFLGLRNAAVGALFPALTELAKALTNIVSGNREKVREFFERTGEAIISWVERGGIEELVAGVKEFAESVKQIADALGGLKGVAVAAGVVMGSGFLASVVTLGQSLWTLGAAAIPMVTKGFMLLLPYLTGAASAIGGALASAASFVAPMFTAMASGIAAAATAAAPFVAAALGVASAGYAVYQNWNNIKELFTDFTGPGGLLATMKEMLTSLDGWNPGHWLATAGEWWGNELFGAKSAAPLGAANAAPAGPNTGGEARVTVDFNNLPAGARVKSDPNNTAELNVSMGYSMMVP